jgi:hypothetical protein
METEDRAAAPRRGPAKATIAETGGTFVNHQQNSVPESLRRLAVMPVDEPRIWE